MVRFIVLFVIASSHRNHFLYHSGCVIPTGNSVTTADYMAFYLKQGWNRLPNELRDKEVNISVSVVYDIL